MKNLYFIILFSLSQFSFGQNLVPNGSFEQYDTCMMNSGTVYRAVGWENIIYDAEYYNSCANGNEPTYGVPQNDYGYQMAEDGDAYIEMQVYQAGIHPNGSEAVGRQLSQPLVVGQRYYCSFYVSAVDSGDWVFVNKIGMKFSTVNLGCAWCLMPGNPSLINNSAAIYSNNIITDKINWTKISGWYIADSAYDYMMIGNFFDALHTDTLNPTNSSGSVYYFDNVYVGIDSVNRDGIPNIYNNDEIRIYPNPANESLTISSKDDSIEYLELYSILGKLIYAESVERKNEINISVSNIIQGLYFMKVLTTKNYTVQKIQIIH